MIRYVLVAVLAVALLALSVPAINYAATENSDRQTVSELDSIESAAVSLLENEELPPDGQQRPVRTVTVSLPGDSLTTQSVDSVEIERITEGTSRVTYTVSGRSQQQLTIDAPIVYQTPSENRSIELGGGGDTELELALAEDPHGERVVVATHDGKVETEPPEPASFDVEIVGTNDPVEAGDPIEVTVAVANTGDEVDTQSIDLAIDGIRSDAESIAVEPGSESTVTLSADTEVGDPSCSGTRIQLPIIGELCLGDWESESVADATHEVTVSSNETIDETDVTVSSNETIDGSESAGAGAAVAP
ncbi:DUF7311 family protein [Natronolimnohabitans innermongolicus]|uniref:DUF7311 domain-containing protein n=1 Tax=Natronolimnohabitans innermongolicus JCM 12255 TaxID=1227499 RepID=L9X5F5_9EURY|nr:hypothetical protein [Natronolimnohabitans innermongolicus]ELY56696.1 hypothetical protein C493_09990 [Natronolimnohabitans innermongolicus JCM 12255]